MSLQDFLKKKKTEVQTHGPMYAGKTALQEVTLKGLAPLANHVTTPIWESDAEIILVLDSCRFDLWEEVTGCDSTVASMMAKKGDMWPLVRNTDSIWSVGSASPEWISKTFHDRHREHWENTGYVTANPFSAKQGDELGCLDPTVVPLRERGLAYMDEVWVDEWPMNEGLPTVDPKTLTDRAMWAWQNTEMERLVVHYMQPHIPFRKRPKWTAGWDLNDFGTGGGYSEKDDWHKVRDGEIPADEFWNAYAANLEWVLKEVQRWYSTTDASLLVTSDHGNGMGEFGQWGHPPEVANPAIRKVPWVEFDGIGDNQTEIELEKEPPVTSGKTTSTEIDSQLEALGYK